MLSGRWIKMGGYTFFIVTGFLAQSECLDEHNMLLALRFQRNTAVEMLSSRWIKMGEYTFFIVSVLSLAGIESLQWRFCFAFRVQMLTGEEMISCLCSPFVVQINKRGDVTDEKIKKLDAELLLFKEYINKTRPGPAQDALKARALRVLKQKKM